MELALLAISTIACLSLAVLAARRRKAPAWLVLPCLFALAFGVAVTFYITPNVFALELGGEDCAATTSSILDTVGLVVSSLWALAASEIQRTAVDAHAAWAVKPYPKGRPMATHSFCFMFRLASFDTLGSLEPRVSLSLE